MSITGEADDRPGGGPQKAGVAVSDLMTGMFATQAVLAALFHRERTGAGQYIDIALLDVQVAMLANMNTNYLVSGTPPRRWGNAHPNIVPYQAFRASDQWIIVAVGNDEQYRRFCTLAARPDLFEDARFATNRERVRNRDALVPLLVDLIAERPAHFWLEGLERAGVPCGPINDLAQVFENEQVRARGMRIALERDDAGEIPLVASPMRMSATPPSYRRAPPRVGEHTGEVLREVLGYDDDAIRAAQGARNGVAGNGS
ncbi:MAG TPA: CaiB/BaiF CoA-transferase family protein, partial [Zeimonas sp.]